MCSYSQAGFSGIYGHHTKNFPKAKLIDVNETYFAFEQLPENIQNAQLNGNWSYVEEYYALKILCEQGGIVLNPDMQANLNLQKLRLSHIFLGLRMQKRYLPDAMAL